MGLGNINHMNDMTDTNYRAKDFARLFRSIPDEQWTTGSYRNGDDSKRCALGHAGADFGSPCEASNALEDICIGAFNRHAAFINDSRSTDFPQPTPKLRMVAAMDKAKELGF